MLITRYSAVNPPALLFNGSIVMRNEAADPAEFLKSSYRQMNISYPKFFKMDNLCKLAFLSAEILLKDAELLTKYPSEEIGMIILNSSSSLETDEKHQESISDRENYFPSPSVFVYTLPNIMTGEIAIRHKIKGENGVFISEKPDAGMIFTLVDELFSRKRVSCCITGWVESYHSRLSSCLMLVENEEKAKTVSQPQEIIIFDPSNLERLFKEDKQDGTYGKA
ncbi:MAG: 3-oxoacyl-ACP synthase [Bacteroidales bacterium]|nr:3-oxoacyl-ACP synthase [Bacteroidales bacterium]